MGTLIFSGVQFLQKLLKLVVFQQIQIQINSQIQIKEDQRGIFLRQVYIHATSHGFFLTSLFFTPIAQTDYMVHSAQQWTAATKLIGCNLLLQLHCARVRQGKHKIKPKYSQFLQHIKLYNTSRAQDMVCIHNNVKY